MNATDPKTNIACVYALSGYYGAMPRYLYYVTLLFAIFGRNREWLVIGALVSSLTYAGTAAIHAMTLVTSKYEVFDLDCLGAWAVISTAALQYVAMIHWSSTLRNSGARAVMVAWGMLIGTGLIFNRTTLFDQGYVNVEAPCYSSDGMLLTMESQLISNKFNCTYQCFNVSKPMRGRNEIMAIPATILENKYSNLSYILIGPVMFAAYAAISWDSQSHTPSQFCTRWIMKYHLDPRRKDDMIRLICNASNETWYGGYFVLWHFMKGMPWNVKKILLFGWVYPWIMLTLIMDILCLPFLILTVTLNELHILGSRIPVGESIYNVGQWSTVVNSALVVIAAIINKGLEIWNERKKKKTEVLPEHEPEPEKKLRRVDTDATLVEETDDGYGGQSDSFDKYPPRVHLDTYQESTRGEARLV